jgi:hypothetical protein
LIFSDFDKFDLSDSSTRSRQSVRVIKYILVLFYGVAVIGDVMGINDVAYFVTSSSQRQHVGYQQNNGTAVSHRHRVS